MDILAPALGTYLLNNVEVSQIYIIEKSPSSSNK
jgi:hypothetical protein